MDDPGANFVRAELVECLHDRFRRSADIRLDHDSRLAHVRRLQLCHHLFERTARSRCPRYRLFAGNALAVTGDFTGASLVLDYGNAVARHRSTVKAEYFHRHRWCSLVELGAMIVDQGSHLAPLVARDKDVAGAQRAAVDEYGCDRAASLVELGLDHNTLGRSVGIGLDLHDFRLEQNGFQQLVDTVAGLCRDFHVEYLAAHRLDEYLVLQQFIAHLRRIGRRQIHLVDRDDDRNIGRFGMIDGFHRLRHHAVIGGDHQNRYVGRLRAACAHGGERLVARRVDEGNFLAVLLDLIGADMLGDAPGFPFDHASIANGVEQRRLAVIDMAHNGHDRRTRLEISFVVSRSEQTLFDIRFRNALDRVAEFAGDKFSRVGVDHVTRLHHLSLFHEVLDDVHDTFGHAAGKFLNGDSFGQGNLS